MEATAADSIVCGRAAGVAGEEQTTGFRAESESRRVHPTRKALDLREDPQLI